MPLRSIARLFDPSLIMNGGRHGAGRVKPGQGYDPHSKCQRASFGRLDEGLPSRRHDVVIDGNRRRKFASTGPERNANKLGQTAFKCGRYCIYINCQMRITTHLAS
uniref:Uncharacterized protein n=1 Tax=Coccidioides posadasii RMSCC 3488 TaxID=454284 RepID=A0A0J6FBQ9_COCPO|nr:hypothetical protein CPAG_03024 [Coccidioides posadasii RMSCC 3488]